MHKYILFFLFLTEVIYAQTADSTASKTVMSHQTENVLPQFPGGNFKLIKFLQDNLKYPAEARKANVKGEVKVSFWVDAQGNVSGATIEKGIGYGCDEEAIRVIGLMPKWIPGVQYGSLSPVKVVLPIRFLFVDLNTK